MKLMSVAVVFGAIFSATPAFADVFCVQQQLTNLGYEPGPVDGALGGKTASAAAAFATDFAVTLPALDKTNSQPWCESLAAMVATPEGIARRFDVTSPPEGVLSQAATQKLWDMYKNIDECLIFDAVPGGKGTAMPLSLMPAEALASTVWKSPFTQAISAPACTIAGTGLGNPPAPIPVVKINEAYGERVREVDAAMLWFEQASTFVRLTGDPVARQALKLAVLDWAKNDSLGKGIQVSWGNRPIDYQMLVTVLSVLTATAEVIPDLSEADKAVVGPWLNRLVKVAADSYWKDRTDNKVYERAYVALLWGIIAQDDAAVREAVEVYKLAIHDMRPDGSFPIDTQRGGMGVQYNASAAVMLMQMAMAMETAFGVDLYAYSVDGRSLHNAVDFLVRSIQAPGETNAIYAISCPESGDRWGSIDKPSTDFFLHSTALLVYADRFPDNPESAWIKEFFARDLTGATVSERSGGAPACQFATPTNVVFSGEPIKLEGIYALPKPEFVLFSREEMAHKVGMDGQVNSLLFAEMEQTPGDNRLKIRKVSFNIVGRYDFLNKTFSQLSFVFGQGLAADDLEAIRACGRSFDIDTWDDGTHHLIVKFDKQRKDFSAPDLACVLPLVPEEAALMAQFITGHFRDFAIGMVQNNALASVRHDGLRQWLENIAIGEGSVIPTPTS